MRKVVSLTAALKSSSTIADRAHGAAGGTRRQARAPVAGITTSMPGPRRSEIRSSETWTGRLIEAHDSERMRIARRLHDEVSQQLAGLSLAMSGLKRSPDTSRDTRAALTALQQMTIAIAETIRQLSNELHPTTLQHVGLIMALSTLCRDYAARMTCAVTLESREAGDIPPDAALCFYRAAEEALRNVQAHARASHVAIEVFRTAAALTMTISDDGRGLSTKEAGPRGLGLMIVEQRVQALGGWLCVEARPEGGTRVSVTLPDSVNPPAV